ncbi:RING finger domain-containing protein [Pangasianodon hypophthalmus]|uniref:RING finger domain-containing protein n=1 Tax=Pangasianodon hypophthalmus TaxID=310915 RepID=UPI000F007164|nr:RING finger domain-containing protein [Pangasianodon hypophthalmus]XP_026791699.1 RING finger domain-containing protein [Pangasianodon hypophthalmus]XP_034159401.1 RING finger domain-containing protein [Pangasianodon hypophthalmus]XP_053089626.1 RING finger domain-containing protein [Pangasianodon hypophthalmus]
MSVAPVPVATSAKEETSASGDSPEVECPVCYQEYDKDRKLPRMLECLHVFCTECLHNIQLSPVHPPDPNSPPSISCPLCRHSTPLEGGDAHSLPCNSRILAQLPPVTFRLPVSVSTRLATVTQRVILSLESRDARFIILPTVSLRVEQMGEGTSTPESIASTVEGLRRRKSLMCVQMLVVIFWMLFVLACVVGVLFGPNLFHH